MLLLFLIIIYRATQRMRIQELFSLTSDIEHAVNEGNEVNEVNVGFLVQTKQIFFFLKIIFFHGQRQVLQLVLYKSGLTD